MRDNQMNSSRDEQGQEAMQQVVVRSYGTRFWDKDFTPDPEMDKVPPAIRLRREKGWKAYWWEED